MRFAYAGGKIWRERLSGELLAAAMAGDHLVERFGIPRTSPGLEARYAIVGLGKLGAAALGYTSDIEILLVYSDHGETDGTTPTANSEFFERFALVCLRAFGGGQGTGAAPDGLTCPGSSPILARGRPE